MANTERIWWFRNGSSIVFIDEEGHSTAMREAQQLHGVCCAAFFAVDSMISTKENNDMDNSKKRCPQHGEMILRLTKYGNRYECKNSTCSVACWDGPTSTPANAHTRKRRMEAHDALDPLWLNRVGDAVTGKVPVRRERRTQLYRELAVYMDRTPAMTHIGMFTEEECVQVLEFVRLKRGLPLDGANEGHDGPADNDNE